MNFLIIIFVLTPYSLLILNKIILVFSLALILILTRFSCEKLLFLFIKKGNSFFFSSSKENNLTASITGIFFLYIVDKKSFLILNLILLLKKLSFFLHPNIFLIHFLYFSINPQTNLFDYIVLIYCAFFLT